MEEEMRIALLAPPIGADAIHPYSALPVLSAFLRAHGYNDIEQRDIGIEALDHFMTEDYLRRAEEEGARKIGQLRRSASLGGSEDRILDILEYALRNSRQVIKNIEKAKRTMRSSDFYDAERVGWAKRVIGLAYNLLSSASYPTMIASGHFVMPSRSLQNSRDIIEGGRADEANPFVGYYRDHVVSWLKDYAPALIGISITYESQLICALALARVIKEAGLPAHITLGGSFVSWLCHFPAGINALLEFSDTLIVNEGETALLQLVQALEQKREKASLGRVRNIVFKRDKQIVRGPWQMENLNETPTPSWQGLFNGKYLAPAPVYLYQTSRGCYAKCAFCCVSMHQKENGFRRRSLDNIIEDIKKISSYNHGEQTYIFIADDTHSPAQLRYLAKRLLEEGLTNLRWMCEARLDKGFTPEVCDLLYKAGLRHIFFGMESANQRVLDKMMKGTYLKYMSEGIINTSRAGIGSYISLVIGFPTETEEEACDTINFIIEHAPFILAAGFNPFQLPWGSYVHMKPEEFGVTFNPDPDQDIQIVFDYDVKTGINQARARELALEAQRRWQEAKSLPYNMSQSRFDGYMLLYLSRHEAHFADKLFPYRDPSKIAQKAKTEPLRYVSETVWSSMTKLS
jgi:hypothetical protein